MTRPRLLIAGIGNIFLGDDAFGSEVARRLAGRFAPEDVRVIDFGIRGFDLTYALLEDFEVAILVDAVARGGEPGTVYLIEPDRPEPGAPEPGEMMIDPHHMDPAKVLRLVAALGGNVRRLLLVGCEPSTIGTDDDLEMAMGMSGPVRAAVDEALALIESLVASLLAEGRVESLCHDR